MEPRSHLCSFEFPIPEEILEFDSYPKITNYVATVSLDVQFNLNSLVLYLSSTDRKPSRFAAITIKIHPTTCLLFSSGNMVITGGRTEMGAKLAAHTYRLILEKIPQPVFNTKTGQFIITTLEDYTSFNNFTVVNIVGSGKLFQNNQVNLGSLSKDNIGRIGWDAQIFPGLRFTIKKNAEECPIEAHELMAHIFQGANDVIMGARVKEDIYKAHIFLKRTVLQFLSNPIQEIDKERGDKFTLSKQQMDTNHEENTIELQPKRRGKPKKNTNVINAIGGTKQLELAREHTKMLQNALKSQRNITIDGAGIKKKTKTKKRKPTRIQNPRSPSNSGMEDEDEHDEDISEMNTAGELFTRTSALAIADEIPVFRRFIQEDSDMMSEFMDEFNEF